MYNKIMNIENSINVFFTMMLLFFVLLLAPIDASAQYVPVNDATLISDFNSYATKFDTYAKDMNDVLKNNPDSLRNLITANNLTMAQAGGPCIRGDNMEGFPNAAFAYTTGSSTPWKDASASSTLPLGVPAGPPAATKTGPYVQVNYSHSLRCLLEEQVEWQKLGLSLQIHQLLKSYITDAQTAQLNNQLMNKMSAANINWAKAGNEVVDNGMVSNSAVYNANASQSIYNVKARQLEHAVDQAASDPLSGNPVGSWDVFPDWRLDTAANMANNARSSTEDPFNYTQSITGSSLSTYLNPGDSSKFMENFNDPANLVDGISTFSAMLNNPANSPLGASTLADQVVQGRLARQEEAKRQDMMSSGFSSVTECSGRPDDPYCLEQQNSIAATPAGEAQRSGGDSAGSGNQQVRDTKTLDSGAGNPAEAQSAQIAQEGLNDFDTTPLQTSKNAVNELVKELYDTMYIGYFGVSKDTSYWSQATMLMIYDEMKFNSQSTAVVVTDTNQQDALDTGYSGWAFP